MVLSFQESQDPDFNYLKHLKIFMKNHQFQEFNRKKILNSQPEEINIELVQHQDLEFQHIKAHNLQSKEKMKKEKK